MHRILSLCCICSCCLFMPLVPPQKLVTIQGLALCHHLWSQVLHSIVWGLSISTLFCTFQQISSSIHKAPIRLKLLESHLRFAAGIRPYIRNLRARRMLVATTGGVIGQGERSERSEWNERSDCEEKRLPWSTMSLERSTNGNDRMWSVESRKTNQCNSHGNSQALQP